jgi:AcrR family transcriptional regulator
MIPVTNDGARGRALTWGADLPVDEDEARQRLLDAAEECYAERGPSRTKITHIAQKAGIHRCTVYAYFANRDEVLAASFLRAVSAVLEATEGCWLTDQPFVDQVVDSCIVGLDAARKSPAMRLLTAGDDVSHTQAVAAASTQWRSRLKEALGERMAAAAARHQVRSDIPPETLAEWVTRICFSLIAEPARPEHGGDEGLLRGLLVPALSPVQLPSKQSAHTHNVDAGIRR